MRWLLVASLLLVGCATAAPSVPSYYRPNYTRHYPTMEACQLDHPPTAESCRLKPAGSTAESVGDAILNGLGGMYPGLTR